MGTPPFRSRNGVALGSKRVVFRPPLVGHRKDEVDQEVRRCWGRTKNLTRCLREGDWLLFCHEHKYLPFKLLILFAIPAVWALIKVCSPATLEPRVVIEGAMPIHLSERETSPDEATFYKRRLAFIIKIANPSKTQKKAGESVLEGCVPIDPWLPRDLFIDQELLPEKIVHDKALGSFQKTAVQKIRASGSVRSDSAFVPPLGVGYVGVLFSLPPGRTGAMMVVKNSASLQGKCDEIPTPNLQPSVAQLFQIGPIHSSSSAPTDVATGLRDGSLRIELRIGGDSLVVDHNLLLKLYPINWRHWDTLDLGRMYEEPDNDYPPSKVNE